MAEGSNPRLPTFDSLDELIEFVETHDMGDYWDELPEADFEVDLQSRTHLVAIDAALAQKLSKIAQSKQISCEELINTWLTEKASEQF